MIITNLKQKINIYSQKDYDNVINQINFKEVQCSCGHYHFLVIHGYYYRYLTYFFKKIKIRVLRVKCTKCGKTHSVLIEPMIPFLCLSFTDVISIIINNDHDDHSYMKYIKFLFNQSLSYLKSVKISCRNYPLIIITT